MCDFCGCSDSTHTHDPHHHHDHHHTHDHDHEHPHHHTHVTLKTPILARNDAIAAQNRQWLASRGILAINLISSPGSGKTTLLETTLDALAPRIPCAVITGDQQTDRDARRLAGRGAPVHQIETHDACHLSAQHLADLLPAAVPEGTRLLFIENVGNLVCPAGFDLGETCKVALLATTEGEDKPLKYPTLFQRAAITLITKTDLIPYLDWNLELCRDYLLRVHPHMTILPLSSRSGQGMPAWIEALLQRTQTLPTPTP